MENNKKLRRKKKLYKMIAKEDGGVNAISLVLTPAIMKEFVALSRQPQKRVNLQEDKRIIVSPVLIPDIEIPRFDEETNEEYDITFGKEEIAKIAENFLINGYQNEATLEHDEEVDGVSVIESWIKESENDKSLDFGFGDLPIGTWFVKMKIYDNELWAKIKSGEIRGLSIEGMFGHELIENAMVKMRAQNEEVKAQNVLNAIRDIINEDIDEALDTEVLLSMMKGIIKNDARYSGGKKLELESYNDYPSGVVNNAKAAVEWAEKNGWGSCGTPVGKIRASQLANKKPISVSTIKRMRAYLLRHEVDLEKSTSFSDGCGYLMYQAWGGKAGLRWATSKLKELGVLELSNEEIYGKRYEINLYETEPNFTNNYTTPAMDKPTYFDLNSLDNACWEGYVAIGTKMLNGKEVPNCVPEEKLMALAKAIMEMGDVELETAVGIASSYSGQFGGGKPMSEADYLKKRNAPGPLLNLGGYFNDENYSKDADEASMRYKSFAKVGPRGGITESPKAPKSDTPNPNPKGEGTAKGDASGKRGAEVSAKDEETLKNKVKEFNDREANTKNGNATLGVLKSVFQRGLGAFNTSRSPKVSSPSQWAFARVNSFLYLLKNGRPENPKYTADNDLLPKGHPKAD